MENQDREELEDMKARAADPEAIIAEAIALGKLPCRECDGRKVMDYLIFRRAPWYMRIFGTERIRILQKDVTCKRCKGSGMEMPQ